jgi:hypothetical protein
VRARAGAALVAALAALAAGVVRAAPADAGTPPDATADAVAPDAGPSDGGAADGLGPGSPGSPGEPIVPIVPIAPIVPDAAPAAAGAPVRGTVFTRGGHRRVAGAIVLVDGVVAGEADDQGVFAVTAPPGRHRLQVTASGHRPVDLEIDVPPSGWSGEVRLPAGGAVLETVVATKQAIAATKLGGEEARDAAGTGGDPVRVVESLPGVSQIVWPFALYAIRGANPGNTGFFLDGMRVPTLFHFALGPSIVHPYLIDKLTFYPGGYPARVGGYVSGIVAIETGAPPNDLTRFAADARLYDAGGLAVTPWDGGRGTVAVAAHYSYTGLLVSRLSSDVSFGYADYTLRVDHTLAGGRLTLLALGSYDTIDVKRADVGNGSLMFHRADLRWERLVGGGRLTLRSTFAVDDAQSNIYDVPIGVVALTAAPRLSYARPITGAIAVEGGLSADLQHFSSDVPPTNGGMAFGDLARSRGALTAAAFAGARFQWRRFSVEPGLRASAYAEQGTTRGALEPRLAARVGLGEAVSVDVTAGRFTQMPSLPIGVGSFEAFGLADLGLQTSTQVALGVETKLPGALTLRLVGFQQWMMVSDLFSQFARDVTNPDFLEMRPARGYGTEVMLRLPEPGRVFGWLAYTLSWSTREIDGVDAPSDWDQRHILNLVSGVRLRRGWSVGGRFHFNTGRPYSTLTDLGTMELVRLPPFWQVDLRAAKRVVYDRLTVDWFVELGNATLTRQVTAYQRPIGGGPNEEAGFRIVLPSIGVHAEW